MNGWEDCLEVCSPVAVSHELSNSFVALALYKELVWALCEVLTSCLLSIFHVEKDLWNIWTNLGWDYVEGGYG